MLKTFSFLAVSFLISAASAQTHENVTMGEHDKAVEMCKQLKIKGSRCKEVADQCHGEKDIPSCMKEKAKSEK